MNESQVAEHWSDAERCVRKDLAHLYRLVAHFRMTDLIDTHISARIPGTDGEFLINEYGVLFEHMRPQDLVRVDIEGRSVAGDGAGRVNAAGFTIHSAIHSARHELQYVVHTHTADGIAVSCQQEGLLPISQHALRYYGHLAYHDYEGVALDLDERTRLIADLGEHDVMILRNHGLLATGRSVAEAFSNIYYLERACQAQVKAQSSGRPLTMPSEAVCRKTAAQFRPANIEDYHRMQWQAALRLIA